MIGTPESDQLRASSHGRLQPGLVEESGPEECAGTGYLADTSRLAGLVRQRLGDGRLTPCLGSCCGTAANIPGP